MKKINSKRVAGVSINLDFPPAYEVLMGLALKTKEYRKKPVKEANRLIAKELRANGFTQSRKPKRKKQEDKRESD